MGCAPPTTPAEAPVWVEARGAGEEVVSDEAAGKGGDRGIDVVIAVIGVGIGVLLIGGLWGWRAGERVGRPRGAGGEEGGGGRRGWREDDARGVV